MARRTAVLILAVSMFLLNLGFQSNAQQPIKLPEFRTRTLYGKTVELLIDQSRIAVFREGDLDGSQTRAALLPLGFTANDVTSYVVDGWSYVTLPRSIDSREQVEAKVRQVGAANAVDFVSPVFLDEYGRPMHATPDLLIRFVPGTTRNAALLRCRPLRL